MLIREIFGTPIEEKIEPVIKVGDRQDQGKLAAEIGRFVVTPTIEKYLDDFLEHYTGTMRLHTAEIGVWISGYFGSGKSHLGKMATLLVENPVLDGVSAVQRFQSRIPPGAPHRDSLIRSLALIPQCETRVLAFNVNSQRIRAPECTVEHSIWKARDVRVIGIWTIGSRVAGNNRRNRCSGGLASTYRQLRSAVE